MRKGEAEKAEKMAELGGFKGAGGSLKGEIREKMRKEEDENGRYMAVLRDVEGRKPVILKEPCWGEDPVRL